MSSVYKPSLEIKTSEDGWRIGYVAYKTDRYDYSAKYGCKIDLIVDEPQRIDDAVLALESMLTVIRALRAANDSVRVFMGHPEEVPDEVLED